VDCLVDAARRQVGGEGAGTQPHELQLARGLLRGIRIRNFFQYRNAFYDDMAWLALAADRAGHLTEQVLGHSFPNARTIALTLGRQLVSASTGDLGGGLFWNTRRRYKNTASTGPAALFFARTGERGRAQALVDWLDAMLFDPGQGLYLDGITLNRDGSTELVRDVWAYNQGTVLGALLELGGSANLARAEALIASVGRHLTVEGAEHDGARGLALRGDGGGDAGLFMGILARYLTLAALDPRLPEDARGAARDLVVGTAEALWSGAELRPSARSSQHWTFPRRPGEAASAAYPPGRGVELSTQLQAWMVLEGAHLTTSRGIETD
jgi:predicted alpha-1,6-mannanase (GH76 family)